MNNSYRDRFQVVEIIKNNSVQKIMIATDIKKIHEIVLINILNNEKGLLDNNEALWRSTLDGLILFEATDDEITLITTVQSRETVESYLKKKSLSEKERFVLIHQYLKGILRYEPLPNHVKNMMIGLGQVVIDGEHIAFTELLILEETDFSEQGYKVITRNIGEVLNYLMTEGQIAESKEVNNLGEIQNFIENLQQDEHHYRDIRDIFNSFRGLYTYHIWMPPTIQLQDEKIVTQLRRKRVEAAKRAHNKTRNTSLVVGVIGILMVGIAGVYSNWGGFLFDLYTDDTIAEPTEILGEEATTEVLNEYGDEVQEKIVREGKEQQEENNEKNTEHPRERLEDVALTYGKEENIARDYGNLRSGKYSLRLDGEVQERGSVQIKDVILEVESFVSFWVQSDAAAPLKITLEGYGNDHLLDQQTINYQPSVIKFWERIDFQPKNGEIDELHIIFSEVKSVLWIDDIKIDVFK
ncbi:hypothetical protein Amet_0329 [Alkaliphilus metalliredigens QYMF]|uniref:Uncharacterized protein n=1 Tax=Alkaliphilus metalliredigens (strain QYMF) TaxID=293826 RepID=A6TK41_ALKMQ|nr:hypothetical protein [Alkaliphilus metalliredigens]ABR46559.1 hypothetical protein Amet_0329 [Alkaliphilus metalliredigens QYMF]